MWEGCYVFGECQELYSLLSDCRGTECQHSDELLCRNYCKSLGEWKIEGVDKAPSLEVRRPRLGTWFHGKVSVWRLVSSYYKTEGWVVVAFFDLWDSFLALKISQFWFQSRGQKIAQVKKVLQWRCTCLYPPSAEVAVSHGSRCCHGASRPAVLGSIISELFPLAFSIVWRTLLNLDLPLGSFHHKEQSCISLFCLFCIVKKKSWLLLCFITWFLWIVWFSTL